MALDDTLGTTPDPLTAMNSAVAQQDPASFPGAYVDAESLAPRLVRKGMRFQQAALGPKQPPADFSAYGNTEEELGPNAAPSGETPDFASFGEPASAASSPNPQFTGAGEGTAESPYTGSVAAERPEENGLVGLAENFVAAPVQMVGGALKGAAVAPSLGAEELQSEALSPEDLDIAEKAAAESAARPAKEQPLYQAGEATESLGQSIGASEATQKAHPIMTRVGSGLGNVAAGIAMGVVNPVVGLVGNAAMFGLSGAGDAYDAAKKAGASDHEASEAASISGAASAALGSLPVASVLKPFTSAVTKGIAMRILAQAAENGVVFTGVGEAQNYIDQQIAPKVYAAEQIANVKDEQSKLAAQIAQVQGDPRLAAANAAWLRQAQAAIKQYDDQIAKFQSYVPELDASRITSEFVSGALLGAAHAGLAGAAHPAETSAQSVPSAGAPPPPGETGAVATSGGGPEPKAGPGGAGAQAEPQQASTGAQQQGPNAQQTGQPPQPEPPPSPFETQLNPNTRAKLEEKAAYYQEFSPQIIASWSDDDLKNYVNTKFGFGSQRAADDEILRRYGFSAADVSTMSPEQKSAAVDEAVRNGVPSGQAESPQQRAEGTASNPVDLKTPQDVATAAAIASQDHTPAQGEAGNVQRGHATWNGLNISIEVPPGGVRKGTVPGTGEAWEATHPHAYGEILGVPNAADGMRPDVIVGDHPDAPNAYVIDEKDRKTGQYKQSKALIGFLSPEEARASYLGITTKTPDQIAAIKAFPSAEFPDLVRQGLLSQPVAGKGTASNVPSQPQGESVEAPTTEPLSDIQAQIQDLSDPNSVRQAVWLPPSTVTHLRSLGALDRLIAPFAGVKNLDGQGGMLVAHNQQTAKQAIKDVDNGQNLQAVIGGLTGAGTGKTADMSAVVQQRDAAGNVTRERGVRAADVAATQAEFAAPGRTAHVLPVEEALRRRAGMVAAEQSTSGSEAAAGENPSTPADHQAIEDALRQVGVDPKHIRPVDIARAAEIHAQEGYSPEDSFQLAVARAALEDGLLTPEQIEQNYGPHIAALLRAPEPSERSVLSAPSSATAGRKTAAGTNERIPGGGENGAPSVGGETQRTVAPAESVQRQEPAGPEAAGSAGEAAAAGHPENGTANQQRPTGGEHNAEREREPAGGEPAEHAAAVHAEDAGQPNTTAGARPGNAVHPASKAVRRGRSRSTTAKPFGGMIENEEKYRAAAKKRRERGLGTVTVYKSTEEMAARQGIKEAMAEHVKRLGDALKDAKIPRNSVPADIFRAAIGYMHSLSFEPLDALDYAMAQAEHEAQWLESEAAVAAVEHVIEREEGANAVHGAVPSQAKRASARPSDENEARREATTGGEVGIPERQAGAAAERAARSEAERQSGVTERTTAGEQHVLPGTERISDAELAKRRSEQSLKPKVAQRPADEGLFSDENKQRDLVDQVRTITTAPPEPPAQTKSKAEEKAPETGPSASKGSVKKSNESSGKKEPPFPLSEPEQQFGQSIPRRHGIPPQARQPIASFRSAEEIKKHPDYIAAKSGDGEAAIRLVRDLVSPRDVALAKERFGNHAIYVPVIAVEQSGNNAIPFMLAKRYAAETGAETTDKIFQANAAFHTGAGPMERLAHRAIFEGPVEPGKQYVLVDDVSVMGSTLADLADHIQRNGGQVAGVVLLAHAGRSPILTPTRVMIRDVERRHGDAIKDLFGIEPAGLTADEAAYLRNFRNADELRARIAAAERERVERLSAKGILKEGIGSGGARQERGALSAPSDSWGQESFLPRPGEPIGAQAQRFVVANGKHTGNEHLVAIDKNGNVATRLNGSKTSVELPSEFTRRIADPANSIVVHHNHPKDSTLSQQDIAMLGMPGLEAVWAHGHGGRVSRASLTDFGRSLMSRDGVYNVDTLNRIIHVVTFGSLFDPLKEIVDRGAITPSRASDLVAYLSNEVLRRAGIIHYQTNDRFEGEIESLGLEPLIDGATRELARSVPDDYAQNAAAGDDGRAGNLLGHPGDVGTSFGRIEEAAGQHTEQAIADRQRRGGYREETARPEQLRLLEPSSAIEDRSYVREHAATNADARILYSDRFPDHVAALYKLMREELNRLGLHDVGLRLADRIETYTKDGKPLGAALAAHLRHAITFAIEHLARQEGRPLTGVLHHEALHALRYLGMFDDAEWRILRREAKTTWREQFKIDQSPFYGLHDEEKKDEEAIAHAYEAWVNGTLGKPKGIIERLFQRIRDFVTALRNALAGLGLRTSQDIFSAIRSGEIGSRPRPDKEEGRQPIAAAFHEGTAPFEDAAREEPGRRAEPLPPHAPRPLTGRVSNTRLARQFKNFWASTFQPELFSDRALEADPLFARYKARQAQEKDAIIAKSESEWNYWNKRPDAERIRFLDDVETGQLPADPRQREMARRYRAMLDKNWELEKQYGSQAAFVEDYLPHIWEKPEEFQKWAQTRSAQVGPTWFQKKRTFDYIKEGLAAGLKLRYTNPIDIVVHRLLSGVDMRQRMDLLHRLKELGLAWEGKQGGDQLVKRGWRAINAPDRKQWVIAPDVQLLWKNGVEAKGLWAAEGLGGSTFRGWMAIKNAWVPIKLAFSAFHPLHVLHIDQANTLALALDDLAKGRDLATAMKHAAEAIGTIPSLGMIHYRQGAKARAAWSTRPSAQTADQKAMVALMTDGGFVPQLSEQLKVASKRQLAEAWQKVRRGEAGISDWRRFVSALTRRPIEALQTPIFEKWIPAIKAAAYLNQAAAVLRAHPEYLDDPVARRIALRAIAKSIDNRYGEMNYGTLFWNRSLKDGAIGSFLSLGWNLGFVREFGGATMEAATRPAGVLPAFQPTPGRRIVRGVTNKITFALSYVGTAALINGLMTYLFTGDEPHGLDYIFARIGGQNPDGSPRRVTNMFYLREVPMLLKHIEEHGGNIIGGAKEMLWNKLMFEPFYELMNNRDYYGYDIWDQNAPIYQQIWQALRHTYGNQFNPMSISGAKHAADLSGQPFPSNPIAHPQEALEAAGAKGVGLSLLGFGPAPAYVEKTPIQNRIAYLYDQHVAPASKPEAAGENTETKMAVRQAILIARRDHDSAALQKAYARGKEAGLPQVYMNRIGREDTDVYLFSRLPNEDQQAILLQSDRAERNRYWPKAHAAVKAQLSRQLHLPAPISLQ